jgi:hypothetical protein
VTVRDELLKVTSPSEEASQRLTKAVSRQVDRMREVDVLARRTGQPSADAIGRLHQRIVVPAPPPPTRSAWPLAVGLLAACAVLAVLVHRTWPAAPVRQDPMQHIKLGLNGLGHVEQPGPQPVVVWEAGQVEVEVEPNQGVQLAVKTEEATITVVGTSFLVTREHFATSVKVHHGVVAVACTDGTQQRLLEGQQITCLPHEPAALLRRVVALSSSGDHEARASAIEAGLAATPAGHPLRAELLARKVELLAAQSPEEAWAAAEAYLASGAQVRRRAMLEFVARERYAVQGCGALEALQRVVQEHPDSSLAVPLADCLASPRERLP